MKLHVSSHCAFGCLWFIILRILWAFRKSCRSLKDRKRLAWRCVISKGLAWGQMRWDRALKRQEARLAGTVSRCIQAPNWEIRKDATEKNILNAISPQPANHSERPRSTIISSTYTQQLSRVLMRTRAWGWKKILKEVRCHKKDYLKHLPKAQEEELDFPGMDLQSVRSGRRENRIRCNIHPTDIIDTPHLEWDTS